MANTARTTSVRYNTDLLISDTVHCRRKLMSMQNCVADHNTNKCLWLTIVTTQLNANGGDAVRSTIAE